jgi:very-short-patch-repair endonuclease
MAQEQHGVVALAQLRTCGVGEKGVAGMVQRGELSRLHRGVYLVGHTSTWLTPFMAAALAGGFNAAVSHRSATYLYKLLPYPAQPGPVHITVPQRHRVGDDNLVIHETSTLEPHEVREVEGIPVISPVRTLIDFAGTGCTDYELESAVAEAFALRLTNRAALLRAVRKTGRRRGVSRLRALLDGGRGPKRTRSGPERRLLSLLRNAGLPEPLTNHKIGPWEVDFFWPAQSFVVEVDAYSTHSSPFAFERDRRKDAELSDHGLAVLRVTRVQLRDEPEQVIARLRRRTT